MKPQRAELPAELRAPLLVLIVVIPLLAFAGFRVHAAVDRTGRYQHDLRVAQSTRGRILRYQLDEETGIRGFVATGDPRYLEPYTKAKARLPREFAALGQGLAALGIAQGEPIAAEEQRLNARWLESVAEPLLTTQPRSVAMLTLMRDGKAVIDAFRRRDEELQTLFNDAAAAADAKADVAIAKLLDFVAGALVILTAAAGVFGWLQTRAARNVFVSRVRYENQKRIADSLQTAFLNKNLPAGPNLGLHATYTPAMSAAQVGGDWYDAFELPDGRILFSIGDVAGHGLEAAVAMSRARQAIIAAALHENDPAKVLERANDAILLQDARMVTAICGYIDPATLEITYATAGHPPPVMARPADGPVFLPADGIPLGILSGATYRTFVATACDGAVLVLYTDGVIEHKRDIIEGQSQLLEAVRLAVLEADPAVAIERIVFAGKAPADDVAILTVRFTMLEQVAPVAPIRTLQFDRLDVPALDEPAERQAAPPEVGSRPSPNDLDAGLRELHARTAHVAASGVHVPGVYVHRTL